MHSDGKIDTLNRCIAEMVAGLRAVDDPDVDLQLGIVAFGGYGARVHMPPTPVADAVVTPLDAEGETLLGAGFGMVAELLDDGVTVPTSCFAPVIVLVSDGRPTDELNAPLASLLSKDAMARAIRVAIAIGPDADRHVLQTFAGADGQVVTADRADDIQQFFRYVTWVASAGANSVVESSILAAAFDDFALADLEF
jgi:uncharacterized protein YegL